MFEVTRQRLPEQVAAALLDYIDSLALKPGDRLPPESKLAADFGVSRQVVREALRSIEAKGVIHTVNGTGTVISLLGADTLRFYFERAITARSTGMVELMEVRRGIEMQAAALAAERRTDEDMRQIDQVIADMRTHLHEPLTYADLDVRLHLLVADATTNRPLCLLIESIRDVVKESVLEGLRSRHSTAEINRVQELHEHIAERIRAGDSEGAMRAMMRHFDDAVMAMVRETATRAGSHGEMSPAESRGAVHPGKDSSGAPN